MGYSHRQHFLDTLERKLTSGEEGLCLVHGCISTAKYTVPSQGHQIRWGTFGDVILVKNQDAAKPQLATDTEVPKSYLPWRDGKAGTLTAVRGAPSRLTPLRSLSPGAAAIPSPPEAHKMGPKAPQHLALQQIELPQPQPEQSCFTDCVSSGSLQMHTHAKTDREQRRLDGLKRLHLKD